MQNQIVYKYTDGYSVILCPNDGKTIIESEHERCEFNDRNPNPIFAYDTGETVVEYSGLAADDKNPQRSWAKATLLPKAYSRLHYHKTKTEHFYIIQGTAIVTLDGDKRFLSAGELIEIQPLQKHQIINPSDGDLLVLLVKCTPSWSQHDFHLILESDKTIV